MWMFCLLNVHCSWASLDSSNYTVYNRFTKKKKKKKKRRTRTSQFALQQLYKQMCVHLRGPNKQKPQRNNNNNKKRGMSLFIHDARVQRRKCCSRWSRRRRLYTLLAWLHTLLWLCGTKRFVTVRVRLYCVAAAHWKSQYERTKAIRRRRRRLPHPPSRKNCLLITFTFSAISRRRLCTSYSDCLWYH